MTATTWNPSDKSNAVVLSNGNLTATSDGSAGQGVRGTNSHSSGKYYFEVTISSDNGGGNIFVAIASAAWVLNTFPGIADANSSGYASQSARIYANSGGTAIVATGYTTGAVISVAVDITNNLVYFALNGVWQNSAVPSSGANGVDYITTAAVYPAAEFNVTEIGAVTLNTGASAFSYAVPSGFSSWDPSVPAGAAIGLATLLASGIFTPQWPYQFQGGRQPYGQALLNPSIAAVKVDNPPVQDYANSVGGQAQIVQAWQPDPFIYAPLGGRQPYQPAQSWRRSNYLRLGSRPMALHV